MTRGRGRPPKPLGEKHEYRIAVHLRTQDGATLKRLAREQGMTPGKLAAALLERALRRQGGRS